MKTELLYLTFTAVFTGLMWVPYVLDRAALWGLNDTVGYPQNPKPQSLWAQRLMRAHANAIENLVVFATLVLVAQMVEMPEGSIVFACIAYFWARVVHAVAYTFGVPWVRTLAFVVGFVAQADVAWQILVR